MGVSKIERITRIVELLPKLSEGQVIWIEKIVRQFRQKTNFFRNSESDLISESILDDFGDALRLHHCFSDEPFTKDKFEYLLVNVFKHNGILAGKNTQNNPGADVIINGQTFSLKTQADKNLRVNFINIHKFMELGRGEWRNKVKHLDGLRNQFFSHLTNYQRILILRNIGVPSPEVPFWKYEMVEIPKNLLLEASEGEMEMTADSVQTPKPGYCRVFDKVSRKLKFELYFDGGSERKLKVNKIDKSYCLVHANWEFMIQDMDEN